MRKQAIILISLILLCSCSPQKRLEILLKKHPELLAKDTITFKDTIYTRDIKIDTSFITNKRDTIIIHKDNLTTQVIRNCDSIYVISKYKGDTIYIEKKVPVQLPAKAQKTIYKELFYILLVFIACLIGALKLIKNKQ